MAIFIACLLFSPLYSEVWDKGQILFQINRGEEKSSIELYKEWVKQNGHQDYELLEEMSLKILNQGIISSEPETQLVSLFGASVSLNEKTERLFELGFKSPYPPIQLAALNASTLYRSATSDFLIKQGLGAAHPLIRLESALLAAKRKMPEATIKIESLMQKMDDEVAFIFPQLFALIRDKESIRILRRMLSNKDNKVRTETLRAIGQFKIEDLVKEVKKCLNHPDTETQEASAFAIGELKEESALPELYRLSKSSNKYVKLSALNALMKLNRKEALKEIALMAKGGDLFAITLLGEYEGEEETLAPLANHPNASIRTLASHALIKHKDIRGYKGIKEILLKSPIDFSFVPIGSAAGTLKAYRAVPSSRQNLEDLPIAFELSLDFREDVLADSFEMNETISFNLLNLLFTHQQNDLVPLAMQLLEMRPNDHTIKFLKEMEQKLGSPFIRMWACLTLMRLDVEGPYEEKLKEYLVRESDLNLIEFRPFIPWELRKEITVYELTPDEKATLFVSALETFTAKKEDKGIEIMLDMLSKGASRNRYVIAGLILRAMQ